MIEVHDHVLTNPVDYRLKSLEQPFQRFDFGPIGFDGIALPYSHEFSQWLAARGLVPSLSFLRKSPAGQVEPHDIHSDADMGDWTALLYLNPHPPTVDGTVFWQRLETGENRGPHVDAAIGKDRHQWAAWRHVFAKFNRCVIFSSALYHSRSIAENYGDGDDARLVQVAFGVNPAWQ